MLSGDIISRRHGFGKQQSRLFRCVNRDALIHAKSLEHVGQILFLVKRQCARLAVPSHSDAQCPPQIPKVFDAEMFFEV